MYPCHHLYKREVIRLKKSISKIIIILSVVCCLIAVAIIFLWKIRLPKNTTKVPTETQPTSVAIAGKQYSLDITTFSVSSSDFDYSQLSQFPSLQSVDVTAVDIDADEYERICSQLGEQTKVLWCIPFNGTRLPSNTSELNISSPFTASDQSLLSYFDSVTNVTITNITSFNKLYPIMKTIKESNPDVSFQCSTSLYGVPLDNNTNHLNLNYIRIQSTDDLCHAIEVFPNLKTVEMCDCGISDKVMAQLKETYPDVKFIWMLHILDYYIRTDAQIFSTLAEDFTHPGDDETFKPIFRYCTELRALDLGHMSISDISEIRNLKNLHTLILADNYITDISPLADLKNLNFLELFQNDIEDISPLLELPNLEDLNICYNPNIKNPTDFAKCKKLNRLYCSHCNISKADIKTIQEGLSEDCEYNWWAPNCVYGGWRHNDKDQMIRNAFAHWDNIKEYPSWDNAIRKS